MKRRTTTAVACICSVAGAFAAVVPARGQDATGGGNVLDANPGLNTGGVNQRSWQPNYRARNLVVTGNVPGGRGFRGSVGYTAARDFRGVTGSDALFEFRAGSAFSDISFVGLGRTSEQFRFGQDLGQLSFRRSSTPPSYGTLPGTVPDPRSAGMTIDMASRLQMDRILQAVVTDTVADTSARPSVVGRIASAEGEAWTVSASSLRGVTLTPAERDLPTQQGLSTFDVLQFNAEQQERIDEGEELETVGRPFQVSFEAPFASVAQIVAETSDDRTTVEPLSDRIDVMPGTDYERILRRIVLRYADATDVAISMDPNLVDRLGDDLEKLQGKLIGADAAATLLAGTPGAPAVAATDPGTDPDADPTTDPGMEPGTESGTEPGTEPGQIQTALVHGQTIRAFATDADRGRFHELVRSAEERLKQGEYFFAERRFIRALRFVPGHPLATAGLGHAQFGAGLYNSSALTLRNLLSRHPELIDAKYDPALLPNRVRMLDAVEVMRGGSQLPDERQGYGFLIAYVGHQIDDRAMVEEGLAVIEDVDAGDPLLPVLRRVWLAGTPSK
jgi:hypothetical protein